MSKTQAGLAIFDLDYTLTRRGTWGRFVWRWVKFRPHIWLPLLISAGLMQWQYKRGLRPRVDVKLVMMRWAMKGATQDDLIRRGIEFAKYEVSSGLRAGAIDAIKTHQAKGDVLIIISAAVDIIVNPIGALMGFDHMMSTEMEFDLNGKMQLSFKTPNCYGADKTKRYVQLLEAFPDLKQQSDNVTFYSDSISDLDMFNLAHRCVAVHPDKKLSQHAKEQGWEVANW